MTEDIKMPKSYKKLQAMYHTSSVRSQQHTEYKKVKCWGRAFLMKKLIAPRQKFMNMQIFENVFLQLFSGHKQIYIQQDLLHTQH